MTDMSEPVLEKPGAGLPFLESLMMRFYVGRFIAAKSDWDANIATFDRTNGRILTAIKNLDEAQMQKRILVPRLRGIEDSSRYWSAAMLLEHLVIVGSGMRGIITLMSKGKTPSQTADVADFKPKGGKSAATAIAEFQKFNDTMPAIFAAAAPHRANKSLKYRHPWLGPLTLLEWEWVIAAHTQVHLRQLNHIIKGL